MTLIQNADAFRQAVLRFYQSDLALAGLSGGTSGQHCQIVINALAEPLALNTALDPERVPATQYWQDLARDAHYDSSDIISAAVKIEPSFKWKINANYIGVFEDRFFENEAFTEIIGPNGLLQTDACRVGFLILGKDIYYPDHNHEATELYHTISGTGLWSQSHGDELAKPPVQAVYHEPWETHAMRTTAPILALWSWAGAIDQEAVPL